MVYRSVTRVLPSSLTVTRSVPRVTGAVSTVTESGVLSTITPLTRPPPRRRISSGEAEAAQDPMADPAIRSAVANATFEHLVGFQLTQDQLRYNATR